MSKILIDARQSGTSTGRYHDNLIKNLHDLSPKHDISVLAFNNRVDYLKKIAPNFNIVETTFSEFGLSEQIQLKSQIVVLAPDLVHFGMIQQPILYSGKTVTSMLDLTPLRFKNPSVNSLKHKLRQSVFSFVTKRVAKKSKAIICISNYVKNDVVDYTGVNPDKITVTYNAADPITEKAVPVEKLKGKKFIMYVGRPQPHKNLTRLIEAFVLLQKEHPDLYLVLAGKKDALYEAHERAVKEAKVKNVVFTDFISDGELRWLYEHTACYVFPSLSEGFGLPGLEAMAHGAPVASSNATCLPEIYQEAAAYFDPFDIHAIAVVIDKILTDSEYANKLRTLGAKRYICFSWKKLAKDTLSVYDEVLNT